MDPDPGEVSIEKSEPFTGAADSMDLQATFSRYTFFASYFIKVCGIRSKIHQDVIFSYQKNRECNNISSKLPD